MGSTSDPPSTAQSGSSVQADSPTLVRPASGNDNAGAKAKPAGPSHASKVNGGTAVPSAVPDEALADTVETPELFPPGTMFDERYRVSDCLGRGGMGIVYRAEHVLMGKAVALKVLHPELGVIEELQKRFEREAKSSSLLSQENIVAVTDYGKTQRGIPYLVMELVEGRPLTLVLAQEKRFAPKRAIAILSQVLRGLAHAHGKGVVHRDLKPDNIMWMQTEVGTEMVKLLDFGIAKMMRAASEGQGLTQAGVVFGTPEYMAPEQALGQEVDARADLYAAGVILYEMLTGEKPFTSNNQVELLSMHLVRPVIPPRVVAPEAGISEALEAVVMKALEKKREDRFASAEAFVTELAACVATLSETSGVRPTPRRKQEVVSSQKLERWRKLGLWQRRLAWAVAGVLLLTAFSFLRRSSRSQQTTPVTRAVEKLVEKPSSAGMADRVARARAAIEGNRLGEARALLLALLSDAPEVGVVHLLLGHLNLLERKPQVALADYQKAVSLDKDLSHDAVLLRNAQELFGSKDRELAEAALDLMAATEDEAIEKVLIETASSDRRIQFRHRARAACKERRCLSEVNLVASYGLDLEQGKTCKERQTATEALVGLKDKRALAPLRKALRARGGFLGLAQTNRCIDKLLRNGIASLEGS